MADAQVDTAAEQAVLRAMIQNRDAIWTVLDVLASPADFWDPKHELIARTIVALAHRDEPTDVIAVVAELERAGDIDKAGGVEYLYGLTDS